MKPRSKPRVSFLRAIKDPRMLGGPPGSPNALSDPSFATWHILARMIDGDPLTEDERKFALVQTGRTVLPPDALRRLYLLVGRRGGKSRFLSAFAVWIGAFARPIGKRFSRLVNPVTCSCWQDPSYKPKS
jgi:hypothetical protein